MNEITFNELPSVVSKLADKINNIERLLLSQATTPQPDQERFLTIKETADFIGLTVPTVYGLVHRKDIPCMKRNKRLYFSKQELTAWITTGRKMTVAEIEQTAKVSLSHIGKRKHVHHV